jgi:hypothetical protein
MKKLRLLVAGCAIALVGVTAQAHAALDLTGVTVNTADTYAVAAIVVAGIASIWGIKKVVKLLNRS